MKKTRTLFQFSTLKTASLICVFMIFVPNVSAQEKVAESVQCDQTEISNTSQDCKSHKEYKRKQLVTKKLSPEIRTEALKRDREFDLNKFYPFLVGSGISN